LKVLKDEFEQELKKITQLSSQVNENHEQKILSMMKDHVDEIIDLYQDGNDHYHIEIADLIVLCFELLLLEKNDIDEIFAKCLPRFYKKLNKL
jgi:hypothetical protein